MLGNSSFRQGSEAVLFYLSEKFVVFILFLIKFDIDSNFFSLRGVGGSYTSCPPLYAIYTYMHIRFLHFKQEKPTTASAAPLSQAPGTVSEALLENQKESSDLIHVPPTSEQGQVLVSDPPEDTVPSPSALKGKAGELSVFLCLS